LFVKPGAKRGHSWLFRLAVTNSNLKLQKILDYKRDKNFIGNGFKKNQRGEHCVASVGNEEL
jgi:hypothetical protein